MTRGGSHLVGRWEILEMRAVRGQAVNVNDILGMAEILPISGS